MMLFQPMFARCLAPNPSHREDDDEPCPAERGTDIPAIAITFATRSKIPLWSRSAMTRDRAEYRRRDDAGDRQVDGGGQRFTYRIERGALLPERLAEVAMGDAAEVVGGLFGERAIGAELLA